MKRVASLLVLLVMLAGGGLIAYAVSQSNANLLLFNTSFWAIPVALFFSVGTCSQTALIRGMQRPKHIFIASQSVILPVCLTENILITVLTDPILKR